MISKGIDITKPVVVCGVACREPQKAWSLDHMEQVLTRMAKNFDVQLVFNYEGKEEKRQAEMLAGIMKERGANNIFTSIEATSLRELVAMLANADFYFGNEGGSRHIAQGLGIPSYAVFSPKAWKFQWLTHPSEDNRAIAWTDFFEEKERPVDLDYAQKFDTIKPERVWHEVSQMIERLFPSSKLSK